MRFCTQTHKESVNSDQESTHCPTYDDEFHTMLASGGNENDWNATAGHTVVHCKIGGNRQREGVSWAEPKPDCRPQHNRANAPLAHNRERPHTSQ